MTRVRGPYWSTHNQGSSFNSWGHNGAINLTKARPSGLNPEGVLLTSASCLRRWYALSRLCRVRGVTAFCSKRSKARPVGLEEAEDKTTQPVKMPFSLQDIKPKCSDQSQPNQGNLGALAVELSETWQDSHWETDSGSKTQVYTASPKTLHSGA